MKKLPLIDRHGVVVAKQDWQDWPDWVMFVDGDHMVSKFIVDYEESDENYIELKEATSLIHALGWPAADELFKSLK